MLYKYVNEMFFEKVVEIEITNIVNTEIEMVLSLVPVCLQCSEVLAHRRNIILAQGKKSPQNSFFPPHFSSKFSQLFLLGKKAQHYSSFSA